MDDQHLYEYRARLAWGDDGRPRADAVYDGDTIRLDIDLGLRTWRHGETVRLYGIDAPEIRGPERAEGLIARDWLREVLAKFPEFTVRTHKDQTGKYGRWLAEILLVAGDGGIVNLNRMMLDLGVAKVAPW